MIVRQFCRRAVFCFSASRFFPSFVENKMILSLFFPLFDYILTDWQNQQRIVKKKQSQFHAYLLL